MRLNATTDGTTMLIERIELAPLTAPRPDTPLAAPMIWPRLSDPAEIYGALELGVRDYVHKNGFGSVILGLSGGIDSAPRRRSPADALGPDQVNVILNEPVFLRRPIQSSRRQGQPGGRASGRGRFRSSR